LLEEEEGDDAVREANGSSGGSPPRRMIAGSPFADALPRADAATRDSYVKPMGGQEMIKGSSVHNVHAEL